MTKQAQTPGKQTALNQRLCVTQQLASTSLANTAEDWQSIHTMPSSMRPRVRSNNCLSAVALKTPGVLVAAPCHHHKMLHHACHRQHFHDTVQPPSERQLTPCSTQGPLSVMGTDATLTTRAGNAKLSPRAPVSHATQCQPCDPIPRWNRRRPLSFMANSSLKGPTGVSTLTPPP